MTKTTESASLPFVSLSGVQATGAGESKDLREVASNHTLVVSMTGGGPTAYAGLMLEGSHDDVNWFPISSQIGVLTTERVKAVVSNGGFAVRYVRANLTGYWADGSNPSVTATIATLT